MPYLSLFPVEYMQKYFQLENQQNMEFDQWVLKHLYMTVHCKLYENQLRTRAYNQNVK